MSSTINTVRCVISLSSIKVLGRVKFDFDHSLHNEAGDFRVYANTYRRPRSMEGPRHSALLSSILEQLFSSRSGVEAVHVTRFSLTVECSRAVTDHDVLALVREGILQAGYGVDTVDPNAKSS